MAAIISAEREGTGAKGAFQKIAAAGFDLSDTPFSGFVERYFRESAASA